MSYYLPLEKLKTHARDHPKEFWATLGITWGVMAAIYLGAERFGYQPDTAILVVLLVAAPFLIQYDRRWKRKQAEAEQEETDCTPVLV